MVLPTVHLSPIPVSDVCARYMRQSVYYWHSILGSFLALDNISTQAFLKRVYPLVFMKLPAFLQMGARLGQAHRGSAPYQMFKTADGYITVGGAQENFWIALCKVLSEQFLDDPIQDKRKTG